MRGVGPAAIVPPHRRSRGRRRLRRLARAPENRRSAARCRCRGLRRFATLGAARRHPLRGAAAQPPAADAARGAARRPRGSPPPAASRPCWCRPTSRSRRGLCNRELRRCTARTVGAATPRRTPAACSRHVSLRTRCHGSQSAESAKSVARTEPSRPFAPFEVNQEPGTNNGTAARFAPATHLPGRAFAPVPRSVLRAARRQVSRQAAGGYTRHLSRPLHLAGRRSGHRAHLPFAAAACACPRSVAHRLTSGEGDGHRTGGRHKCKRLYSERKAGT